MYMKLGLSFMLTLYCFVVSFSQELFSTIISNSGDHSIFYELLEFTGNNDLLDGGNYYSVFVPDDASFLNYYSREELDSLKTNFPEQVNELVLHHIVPDTVDVEDFGGSYLPVSGNFIYTFIDGAGNVLVVANNSSSPNPRLKYPVFSPDKFVETHNGRVFWLERNIIDLECIPYSEIAFETGNLMFKALSNAGLLDRVSQSEEPLTFIVSENPETFDYIEDNGGFNDTPFLDSFVLRHIIKDHLPFQKIDDGLIRENWLGETLVFAKQNDKIFINAIEVQNFVDYKNAVTFGMGTYLLQEETSSSVEVLSDKFRVYPNPTNGYIYFDSPKDLYGTTAVIFSMHGKPVLNIDIKQNLQVVDISSLLNGMYVLKYTNKTNKEIIKLLVNRHIQK